MRGIGSARREAGARLLGDIEVTVVTDEIRSFPLPDTFVLNAKKEEVNAALEAAYMPRDVVTINFTPIVAPNRPP